ncbi:hypothetical protein BaRGS_00008884 [Batillaria attramentaria]|uniref:Uncharacterized protein n=1 Tax=Batillaria attramentaria TaxID=370345 RepID=A0ABD0LK62_9CAEN
MSVSTTKTSGEQPLPPSYPGRNSGSPPGYDSLFGKIRAAKDGSSGGVDFMKAACSLLLKSIGCTIILGIILAVPIAMIVMGAKYLHDCPAERYIPIYLLVTGCFGTFLTLVGILLRCCTNNEEEETSGGLVALFGVWVVFNVLGGCFMFAWFIAGNVWIYRTKGEFSTDPSADNYCDPTLYWFAFWITTAAYIMTGVSTLCGCICNIVAACCCNE